MIEIIDAIKALDPNTWVGVSGNDIKKIHWYDGNPKNITEDQIKTKLEELVEADKKLQYQRDREYPPIGDQLDEIYHKGLTEWKKTIKAVKDKHPKP